MMRSWERRVAVMDETTETTLGGDPVVMAASGSKAP
jgi:hypothetical protein